MRGIIKKHAEVACRNFDIAFRIKLAKHQKVRNHKFWGTRIVKAHKIQQAPRVLRGSMQTYSKKVLKHFRNPKNMGSIKNPDGVAVVGNRNCGDVMKMYLKIEQRAKGKEQKEDYIKDIKFQTLGCAAAIATSSVVTTMVKAKSLKEALDINNQKVADELGSLPKIKMHCSVLAVEALKKAIDNYQKKKGENGN